MGAPSPIGSDALTWPYEGRTTANGVDFLQTVDSPGQDQSPRPSLPSSTTPRRHRAVEVLLVSLAYPRWPFVFQPTYAAYLNRIEPWRKTLRTLALKGGRFEHWPEMTRAVE